MKTISEINEAVQSRVELLEIVETAFFYIFRYVYSGEPTTSDVESLMNDRDISKDEIIDVVIKEHINDVYDVEVVVRK